MPPIVKVNSQLFLTVHLCTSYDPYNKWWTYICKYLTDSCSMEVHKVL